MTLKLPKLQLHTKILLALVLGAIFGVIFNVSKYKLEISYLDSHNEIQNEVLQHWESIEFEDFETHQIMATFGPEDQLKILPYFKKLSKREKKNIAVLVSFSAASPRRFESVRSIEKVKTISVAIKPIGDVFIRLLMFVAIPLVIATLIVGAASLGNLKKIGRIGARTLSIYLFTTVVAITIGLVLVNFIQPGTRVGAEAREKLMVAYEGNIQERIGKEASVDLVNMLVNIVSTNPISAMANGEMLQIVFFALMVGVSLTLISKEKADRVIGFFEGISDLMIQMVHLIMKIAPYGVFALIAATVGEFGFDILQTLAWYAATVVFGLLLHTFGTLAILVRLFSRMNPIRFFRGIRQVMLIGFSSSSSAATLPVNLDSCEKNLGVPKQITSFVLPLGATINMDGTSMYQAIAAVFIAQVYGLDLNLAEQLTIILTAVLASIGTAPVPGVGIIMLIIVLRSVHIPEEGIALILGIDRILDMCRTAVNVSGDAAISTIVARQEGVLGAENLEAA
ncbi:MAG: dicarboxylate/amino acid:cation symporter [Ignavibacteria bacterium]|nr:dicarboxylate/amino acid:cation symporter [Ignavibacteria bacterium]